MKSPHKKARTSASHRQITSSKFSPASMARKQNVNQSTAGSSLKVPPRKPILRDPSVKCERCNVTFTTLKEFTNHVATSDKHHVCPRSTCNQDFTTKKTLRRHFHDSRHGIRCRGCDMGFASSFDRDMHLRHFEGCSACHTHGTSNNTNHKGHCTERKTNSHTCATTTKADVKVVIKSSSNGQSKVDRLPTAKQPEAKMTRPRPDSKLHKVPSLPPIASNGAGDSRTSTTSDSEPTNIHGLVHTKSLKRAAFVTATPIPTPPIDKSIVHETSTADGVGHTPEPDPPKHLQHSVPSQEAHVCLACPEVLPSLSASLKHLRSSSCPARLSTAKVAELQRFWYPWEHATIIEVDARTRDYVMSYFCPACGDAFDSIADAVAHIEDRAQEPMLQNDKGSCDGPATDAGPARLHDDAEGHLDALKALENGVAGLRQKFQWARQADGMLDIFVRAYTQHGSFANTIDPQTLQKLKNMERSAREAYSRMMNKYGDGTDLAAVGA